MRQGELQLPPPGIDGTPEKILQFGTGVLLRGLPDYFVDKANRQGKFNGRIIIVKSTDGGDAESFDRQDGLYTICVRGIDNGVKSEENIISSSVSRVISAKTSWNQVMELAASTDISIVISNTTEVGISYLEETIDAAPPVSFPGKLLAFLYERYKNLGGKANTGLVIIPTELIVDNGKKLQAIVNDLAAYNKLPTTFIDWLNNENTFCSSLVDRIVPGKPSVEIKAEIQQQFGYEDELMIMAEVYRLWAIQGDEKVREVLSFAGVDEGVVIEPDIDVYRELKLRMLNGTHTLSCGLAVLAGFQTVKDAMMDSDMSEFIAALMLDEIASGIPYPINPAAVSAFGKKVLDRFRNPFIEHKWISITMQYSSKMKMRNVPVLLKYFEGRDSAPECIALGFAAYILFMRAVKNEDGKIFGEQHGKIYLIQDDLAARLHELWTSHGKAGIVNAVLADQLLWGTDLSVLPGFAVTVNRYLQDLLDHGGKETLKNFEQKKALI
ncbi:MAG: tagaturonate reductase [Chitinophagaceae bacterium]|nr:MAG: tagaturonate reductase [Chitinophagaceae bacterium]